MKFKVGDRVKSISNEFNYTKIGSTGIIQALDVVNESYNTEICHLVLWNKNERFHIYEKTPYSVPERAIELEYNFEENLNKLIDLCRNP